MGNDYHNQIEQHKMRGPMNTTTSFIAFAPPSATKTADAKNAKGNAWRTPARKEAGKQKSRNPEVSISQSTGQARMTEAGTVSGFKTTTARHQMQTEINLGKSRGMTEDFLSKTKNPRLRQDFGEQAHRFTPIVLRSGPSPMSPPALVIP
jgi:hypothetical protein